MVAVADTRGAGTTVGIALGVNVLVAAVKMVAAGLTGSAAMSAEAAHSGVDCLNQVLMMVGIHRARHPDRANAEYVWGVAAAVSMFFTGACYAVWQGLSGLVDPGSADGLVWVAVVVLVGSMCLELVSWSRAFTQLWVGRGGLGFWAYVRSTSDTSTKATFAEDSMDLLGDVVALVGTVLAVVTGSVVFNAWAAIVVGLVIGWVAFGLGAHNTRMLRTV